MGYCWYSVGHLEVTCCFAHRISHILHFLFLCFCRLISFFLPNSLNKLSESFFTWLLLLLKLFLTDDFIEIIYRVIWHHIFFTRTLNVENLYVKRIQICYYNSSSDEIFLHLAGAWCRIWSAPSGRGGCTCAILRTNKVDVWIVSTTFTQETCISAIWIFSRCSQSILEIGEWHLRWNNNWFLFKGNLGSIRILRICVRVVDIGVFESAVFFCFNFWNKDRDHIKSLKLNLI